MSFIRPNCAVFREAVTLLTKNVAGYLKPVWDKGVSEHPSRKKRQAEHRSNDQPFGFLEVPFDVTIQTGDYDGYDEQDADVRL